MRPGFKQTEVGIIPEKWRVLPITSVLQKGFRITYGVVQPGPSRDDGVLFVRGGDIFDGKILIDQLRTISKELSNQYKRTRLSGGEIVISLVGNPGEAARVPEWLAGANIARQVALIRIDSTQSISGDYVCRFLQSSLGRRLLLNESIGSAQQVINLRDITRVSVVLPPESEQRAIAEALSDVDALLDGLNRLIVKKGNLKQATMQQLLTGRIRLAGFGPTKSLKTYAYGSVPSDWDIKPFASVSTMNGRIGWQGLKQSEFTDDQSDPFLITGMNFKDGKIRWDEVYHVPWGRYHEALPIQLKVNDILMTKDGTIGKLLFVDGIPHPGAASLNSHLLVFRPLNEQYVPKFLFYLLGSPTFAQHIELYKSGSTFFGLSQVATGKYPVILPSIREQAAIAAVLSDMDAELTALEARRAKTRNLKQAMMRELLTGRTRLV